MSRYLDPKADDAYRKAKIDVARNMLALGLSVPIIVEATKLTQKEVEQLSKID